MQKKLNFKSIDFNIIFFIVGFLIFPIAIFFGAISIFNLGFEINKNVVISFPIDNQESAVNLNTSNELSTLDATNTQTVNKEINKARMEEASILAYSGPSISAISTVRTGHSQIGYNKSIENQAQIIESGNWNATDYKPEDIIRNAYVVQLGDTLWEIAEAYYGNGFNWVNILNNNKDSIGFLNGEQSLIEPGQILSLP